MPEKKCPRLTIVSTSSSSQKVRHCIPTTAVAWHSVPLVHCVPPECQESVATPGVAVSGEKLRGALHSCAPTPLPAPPSASLLPCSWALTVSSLPAHQALSTGWMDGGVSSTVEEKINIAWMFGTRLSWGIGANKSIYRYQHNVD